MDKNLRSFQALQTGCVSGELFPSEHTAEETLFPRLSCRQGMSVQSMCHDHYKWRKEEYKNGKEKYIHRLCLAFKAAFQEETASDLDSERWIESSLHSEGQEGQFR